MTSYNTYRNLDNLDCIYAPLYAVDKRLKFQMGSDRRQEIFYSIIENFEGIHLKEILLRGCSVKLFKNQIIPCLEEELGETFKQYILDAGYTLEMCLDIAKSSVVVFSYKCNNQKFWACIDDITEKNIMIFGSSARQLAIKECSFEHNTKYHIIKSSLLVFQKGR